MRDFLQGILHLFLILQAHAFGHQKGEGALSEIFEQNLLPFYRFQILRQIVQQIIFGFGCGHAQHRGHQQNQTQENDRYSVADQPSGESFHT